MSYHSIPSFSSSSYTIDLDLFPAPGAQSQLSSLPSSAVTSTSSTAKSSSTSLSSFDAAISTTPPKASDFEWVSDDEATSDRSAPGKVSEQLPRADALRKAADLPVWDANGKERSFKSVFLGGVIGGGWQRRRVMVVFLRWFSCQVGVSLLAPTSVHILPNLQQLADANVTQACQEYVRALKHSLTPSAANRSSAPIPTEIILIGCGKQSLINQYIERTKCPFPIFSDPTLRIFKALGCKRFGGLSMGKIRPEYASDRGASSIAINIIADMIKAAYAPEGRALRPPRNVYATLHSSETPRRVPKATGYGQEGESTVLRKRVSLDGMRGGPALQVGGEFLFEDGQLIWCHRMKHIRDHAETKTLRKVMDMDEETPSEEQFTNYGKRKDHPD